MKKIIFLVVLALAVSFFTSCQKKKNTTQRDNLTQLLLAGGGGGSNGNSCVLGNKCQETEGYVPIQFNFAEYCKSQKGTLEPKTCEQGGFTKDCTLQPQGLGAFKTCSKAQ